MTVHRTLIVAGIALAALAVTPAIAALAAGAKAPPLVTKGALAGKEVPFDLAKSAKKQPVVLYFFPKAFTQGCTLEARAFAEAIPEFKKAGAIVVGVSADNVATLKTFSTQECSSKFAVVSANPKQVADFDVALSQQGKLTGLTTRTSYVIGRDGRVAYVHNDMNPNEHVRLTLQAVKDITGKK